MRVDRPTVMAARGTCRARRSYVGWHQERGDRLVDLISEARAAFTMAKMEGVSAWRRARDRREPPACERDGVACRSRSLAAFAGERIAWHSWDAGLQHVSRNVGLGRQQSVSLPRRKVGAAHERARRAGCRQAEHGRDVKGLRARAN